MLTSQVFRYAIGTGRAERNSVEDLKDVFTAPKGPHLASITEPKLIADLLRSIHGYQGSLVVMAALCLAP